MLRIFSLHCRSYYHEHTDYLKYFYGGLLGRKRQCAHSSRFFVYCGLNGIFIANVCARISRIVGSSTVHMVIFAYDIIFVGLNTFCFFFYFYDNLMWLNHWVLYCIHLFIFHTSVKLCFKFHHHPKPDFSHYYTYSALVIFVFYHDFALVLCCKN